MATWSKFVATVQQGRRARVAVVTRGSAAIEIADLGAARRRSDLYGLSTQQSQIPYLGEPRSAGDALRRISAPVLDYLLPQLDDSSLALILADREGRVTRREAGTPSTLRAMDRRSVAVGFSLAEPDAGTNGVGTSLETKRPTVVAGRDHYMESFHDFTCVNAPILNPISGRVEGTVGILCPVADGGPLMLSTSLQLANQISQLLLEQASPQERFLLQHFLDSKRNRMRAIAAMSENVLIATTQARQLLDGIPHAELWDLVNNASQSGTSTNDTVFELHSPAGEPLRLRCKPLYRDGRIDGATIEFIASRETSRSPGTPQKAQLGELVGSSPAWQALVRTANEATMLHEPVLLSGERGTGRLSIALAIAQKRGATTTVMDSATVLTDGPVAWTARAIAALENGSTVILRRVDELAEAVAAALASALRSAKPTPSIVGTANSPTSAMSGRAALLDQLNVLHIPVPPLRERREDISALVTHLGERIGGLHVDPEASNVLYRQPWPGNVTELAQTLRGANAKAAGRSIKRQHLPLPMRHRNLRQPLHGLRQSEADAIVAAIDATSTKAGAAELLGISRATLYRRINDYGLDHRAQ